MTRAAIILASVVATIGVGYPGLTSMPTKLIWNASASAPIGFYTIDFDGPFEVTDLVAVDAPEPLAAFLSDRGYLPRGVPLLKRILGVSVYLLGRAKGIMHSVAGVFGLLVFGIAAAVGDRAFPSTIFFSFGVVLLISISCLSVGVVQTQEKGES